MVRGANRKRRNFQFPPPPDAPRLQMCPMDPPPFDHGRRSGLSFHGDFGGCGDASMNFTDHQLDQVYGPTNERIQYREINANLRQREEKLDPGMGHYFDHRDEEELDAATARTSPSRGFGLTARNEFGFPKQYCRRAVDEIPGRGMATVDGAVAMVDEVWTKTWGGFSSTADVGERLETTNHREPNRSSAYPLVKKVGPSGPIHCSQLNTRMAGGMLPVLPKAKGVKPPASKKPCLLSTGSSNKCIGSASLTSLSHCSRPPPGRFQGVISFLCNNYGFIERDDLKRFSFSFEAFWGDQACMLPGVKVQFTLCTIKGEECATDVMVAPGGTEEVDKAMFQGVVTRAIWDYQIEEKRGMGPPDRYPGLIQARLFGRELELPFGVGDSKVTLLMGDRVLFYLLTDLVTKCRRAINIVPLSDTFRFTSETRQMGTITSVVAGAGTISSEHLRNIPFSAKENIEGEEEFNIGDEVEFTVISLRSSDKQKAVRLKKLQDGPKGRQCIVEAKEGNEWKAMTLDVLPQRTVVFEDVSTEQYEGTVLQPIPKPSSTLEDGTEPGATSGRLLMLLAGEEKELTFRASDVISEATMLRGDKVQFNISTNRGTKEERATNVEILPDSILQSGELRHTGVVVDLKESFGFISCNQDAQLFFHMSEVMEESKLDVLDKVEFTSIPVLGGEEYHAVRVRKQRETAPINIPDEEDLAVADKDKKKITVELLRTSVNDEVKNLKIETINTDVPEEDISFGVACSAGKITECNLQSQQCTRGSQPEENTKEFAAGQSPIQLRTTDPKIAYSVVVPKNVGSGCKELPSNTDCSPCLHSHNHNQNWNSSQVKGLSSMNEQFQKCTQSSSKEQDRKHSLSDSKEQDRKHSLSDNKEQDRRHSRSDSKEQDRRRSWSHSKEWDRRQSWSHSKGRDRGQSRSRSKEWDRRQNRSRSKEWDRRRSRSRSRSKGRDRRRSRGHNKGQDQRQSLSQTQGWDQRKSQSHSWEKVEKEKHSLNKERTSHTSSQWYSSDCCSKEESYIYSIEQHAVASWEQSRSPGQKSSDQIGCTADHTDRYLLSKADGRESHVSRSVQESGWVDNKLDEELSKKKRELALLEEQIARRRAIIALEQKGRLLEAQCKAQPESLENGQSLPMVPENTVSHKNNSASIHIKSILKKSFVEEGIHPKKEQYEGSSSCQAPTGECVFDQPPEQRLPSSSSSDPFGGFSQSFSNTHICDQSLCQQTSLVQMSDHSCHPHPHDQSSMQETPFPQPLGSHSSLNQQSYISLQKKSNLSTQIERFLNTLNKGVDANLLCSLVREAREATAEYERWSHLDVPEQEHICEDGFQVMGQTEEVEGCGGSYKDFLLSHEKAVQDGGSFSSIVGLKHLPQAQNEGKEESVDEVFPYGDNQHLCEPSISADGKQGGASSPLPVNNEEVAQVNTEHFEKIQNVLQAIGLDLDTAEVSRLADRTQERLYGKKQKRNLSGPLGKKSEQVERQHSETVSPGPDGPQFIPLSKESNQEACLTYQVDTGGSSTHDDVTQPAQDFECTDALPAAFNSSYSQEAFTATFPDRQPKIGYSQHEGVTVSEWDPLFSQSGSMAHTSSSQHLSCQVPSCMPQVQPFLNVSGNILGPSSFLPTVCTPHIPPPVPVHPGVASIFCGQPYHPFLQVGSQHSPSYAIHPLTGLPLYSYSSQTHPLFVSTKPLLTGRNDINQATEPAKSRCLTVIKTVQIKKQAKSQASSALKEVTITTSAQSSASAVPTDNTQVTKISANDIKAKQKKRLEQFNERMKQKKEQQRLAQKTSADGLNPAEGKACKELKNVWICGHSLVLWAEKRARSAEYSLQVGMDPSRVRLWWKGREGLLWEQLLPLLLQLKDTWPAPDVIILHLGGNDLSKCNLETLLANVKKDLTSLKSIFPKCLLVWSSILPRRSWRTSEDAETVEIVRVAVNKKVQEDIGVLGGFVLEHNQIRPGSDSGLYRPDGVHLSGKGIDLFNANIQDFLKKWESKTVQNSENS